MSIRIFIVVVLLFNFLYSQKITIYSKVFGNYIKKEQLFDNFECKGDNVSPDLHWVSKINGVKSFAVTIYDIDAPTNHGWWHWVLYDIPSYIRELKLDASGFKALPKGAKEAKNDYGFLGYGGPCPPKGDKAHRYITTIYALNVAKLNVTKNSTNFEVVDEIKKHTIAKAFIVSRYKRK